MNEETQSRYTQSQIYSHSQHTFMTNTNNKIQSIRFVVFLQCRIFVLKCLKCHIISTVRLSPVLPIVQY